MQGRGGISRVSLTLTLLLVAVAAVADELCDVITVDIVEPASEDVTAGPSVVEDGGGDSGLLRVHDVWTEVAGDSVGAFVVVVVAGGGAELEPFAAGIACGTSVVFSVPGVVASPHELPALERAPP